MADGRSTCESCGAVLPEGARFCPACGHGVGAQVAVAPPWRDLARFVPRAVAERMREAGGRIDGERRPVTVMFADLSGFTAMSERLDPEEVVEITNACLAALVDVVHAHDGSVDKFIGDEIMALFGAPIAHEDDAVRAIRAAFDMKVALEAFNARFADRLPAPLRLHFGLHSGEVVAGSVGHDERMTWSVMGDTVNLAARLADASEAGQIFCSARTRALSRASVACVARPDLHAKGKSRPVQVWDAVGSVTPPLLEVDGPLIGRRDELAVLQEAWEATLRGTARPLLVSGDAGIGKSRLLAAFAAGVDGRVCAVRAGAHPTPFGAVAALARLAIGGNPDDDDGTTLDHLARALARPIPSELHAAAHAVCGLEVPGGEVVGGARRGEALVALLGGARRATLLVVEDLHQADEASQALLLGLARGWRVPRTLLVASWRAPDPPAPDGLPTVVLGALPARDAALVADAQVPVPLPPDVHAFVAARASGNPLFVRQLVRGLVESGAIAEAADGWRVRLDGIGQVVSQGAAGPILARIDRLPHGPREVLGLAAVLGVELPSEVLTRTLGRDPSADVDRLCASGFLVRRPESGGFDLGFAHAMIREVALASMLRERRRKLHRAAILAIEALVPDAAERHPGFLLEQLEGAEEWGRAEALAKSLVVRTQRDAGEVPQALARRAEEVGRAAADERQPRSELLLNLGTLASNLLSVAFVATIFGVGFDAGAVLGSLLVLGVLTVPSTYAVAPWTSLRSVAVDEAGIRVRRKVGRVVDLRWSDLRTLTWERNPGALGMLLVMLRPQWVGRTGGMWQQGRAIVLHHGHTLSLVARDGRTVRLTTMEDRPLLLSITDVFAERARRGEPPIPIGGTFGPYEAVRRTWVRSAAGEDRGAVTFEELVARVERAELGPDDRVAPAIAGEREWETLAQAAVREPKLAAALDAFRVARRPNISHILVLAVVLMLPLILVSAWRDVWFGVFIISAVWAVPTFAGTQAALVLTAVAEWSRTRQVRSFLRRSAFAVAISVVTLLWLGGIVGSAWVTTRAALTGQPEVLVPLPPEARPALLAPSSMPYHEWRELAGPAMGRYAGTPGGWLVHLMATARVQRQPDLALRSATTEAAFAQHPRSWVFAVALTRDACEAGRWSAAAPAVERLTWIGRRLGDGRRACLALGRLELGDRDGALAALDARGSPGGWKTVGLAWARLRPHDLDGYEARYAPVPKVGWSALADALTAEGRDPAPALARAGTPR